MGISDKISNEAQNLKGKVQEGLGELFDNDRLEREGERNQRSAELKKGVEEAKDGVKDVAHDVRDGARDLRDDVERRFDDITDERHHADERGALRDERV